MIEKQQFKNTTGGFIGAVVIGPKGQETGIPVEPGGFVWLSEQEQVLTANAPRRPEDNPFIEQSRQIFDPVSGDSKTETFTPLVPVNEGRYTPSQGRYVPGTLNDAQATAEAALAATGEQPQTVTAQPRDAETRHEEVSLLGTAAMPGTPAPAPPVPSRAAAAAEAEQQEETPEAPVAPVEPPTTPQTPEEAPVTTEETAAVDPAIGEETGAATTPTTPPAEGEYQAHEEVGTPTAPTQPAPYTPPSE